MCKKVIFGFIFLFFLLSTQARQPEERNDNWRYFRDIGVEYGIYIPTEYNNLSNGSITNLHGGYFFNDKLGFRSGITLITGMEGSGNYWKIPFLFSVRTKTFNIEWNSDAEYDNASDLLFNFLLFILPNSYELNIGPSLGYMTPKNSITYITQGGAEFSEIYKINNRFASSIDANLRLSFQLGKICLNGNMGINYLLTKNYDYHFFIPDDTAQKPTWFVNLSVGVSYRF